VLLVGAPGDQVDDVARAGSVKVVGGGDPETAPAVIRTSLSQASPGVAGEPEPGDAFGASLAVSPWSASGGQNRVLVGSPGEDVGAARDGGMISVLTGSDGGFLGGPSLTQNADGLGRAESGDRFGAAVAFGPDFDGIAIGAPGEDVGGRADVGAVSFATVSSSGTNVETPVTRTLDSPGTPGGSTAGDRFGSAMGQLYGSFESVVTVGVPRRDSGSVIVFSSASATRAWKPGQGGVPAQDGRFGSALAGFVVS
jgi:hypothetical protein